MRELFAEMPPVGVIDRLGIALARLVLFRHNRTAVDCMMVVNRILGGQGYWSALLNTRRHLKSA